MTTNIPPGNPKTIIYILHIVYDIDPSLYSCSVYPFLFSGVHLPVYLLVYYGYIYRHVQANIHRFHMLCKNIDSISELEVFGKMQIRCLFQALRSSVQFPSAGVLLVGLSLLSVLMCLYCLYIYVYPKPLSGIFPFPSSSSILLLYIRFFYVDRL